jgi:hypothetical protein
VTTQELAQKILEILKTGEGAMAFVQEHTDDTTRGSLSLVSVYETLTIEIKQLCQEELNKANNAIVGYALKRSEGQQTKNCYCLRCMKYSAIYDISLIHSFEALQQNILCYQCKNALASQEKVKK